MSDSDIHRDTRPPAPPRDALRYRPFRFHLRTVWLVVTLLCVALGLMEQIGPVASLALVLLIGLVLCHVVGNSLGTRLRDEMTAQLHRDGAGRQYRSPPPADVLEQIPVTRLRHKTRVVGRKMYAFCGACAVSVGSAGAYYLADGAWEPLRPHEIALVGCSLAVLGGLFALMAMTFLSVTLRCLGEFQRGRDRLPSSDE